MQGFPPDSWEAMNWLISLLSNRTSNHISLNYYSETFDKEALSQNNVLRNTNGGGRRLQNSHGAEAFKASSWVIDTKRLNGGHQRGYMNDGTFKTQMSKKWVWGVRNFYFLPLCSQWIYPKHANVLCMPWTHYLSDLDRTIQWEQRRSCSCCCSVCNVS